MKDAPREVNKRGFIDVQAEDSKSYLDMRTTQEVMHKNLDRVEYADAEI